ncbi:MAG: UTP--glucose-1-phosphate uridylyltransferase [Kiritimatiellaeota bacterium]|nr:UTP--glucose-1-phosphate uridylyltransferase [Kiritimatiellota bacterium]
MTIPALAPVRSAVIPAAGFGTRFLPASKAVPKEMNVVLDRPAVQWLVEEALAAGVEEVVCIIHPRKAPLVRHFSPVPELIEAARRAGRPAVEAALRRLEELAGRVRFVEQSEQRGLGHAVLCAEAAVGDAPFLVLLGDALVRSRTPCALQLVQARERLGRGCILGLEQVPRRLTDRYGIAAGEPTEIEGDWRITDLVEKPTPAAAPGDLAVAGRYLLEPEVFERLRTLAPGKGGEIQLTDAIRGLIGEMPVHGLVYEGKRYDIGSPEGYLAACIAFARRDPRFRKVVSASVFAKC